MEWDLVNDGFDVPQDETFRGDEENRDVSFQCQGPADMDHFLRMAEDFEGCFGQDLAAKTWVDHLAAFPTEGVGANANANANAIDIYPTPETTLAEDVKASADNIYESVEPEACELENPPYGGGLVTPDNGTPMLDDRPEAPASRSLIVELPDSALSTPVSCFEPFEPSAPILPEQNVVSKPLVAAKEAGQNVDDFVEFQLDDFAVYCDAIHYGQEMRSLRHLDTKSHQGGLYFNGQLSVGTCSFYVMRVPIVAMPIENYGTLSKHTVRGKIWLRSRINGGREIYYRLRTPAKEYRRFFTPFLWVADLAKHFVDFLKVMGESKRKVTIHHFRTTFATWLHKVHKDASEFVKWRNQHPSNDFRTSVAASLGFLHKEAVGVLGTQKTYNHTLWAEIWSFSRYKPLGGGNSSTNGSGSVPPTVVTQYIYDCFAHLPFGDRLQAVPLSRTSKRLQNKLIKNRHLELPSPIHDKDKDITTAANQQIKDIKPGDTISTHRDSEDSGTKWRRDVSHGFNDADRWFALVQGVNMDKKGRRIFDVLWYYRAADTLCGLMKYPWNNELFLSDHCSCSEQAKIEEDEVLGVHEVEFGGSSMTKAEFFCRQTYIHTQRKWITLEDRHLWCRHIKPVEAKKPTHQVGETLLLLLDRDSGRSEPCEFVAAVEEGKKTFYRFRRLFRRREVDASAKNAPPNELIYGNQFIEVKKWRIQGPCHVRFFKSNEAIPTPYDRDGVGAYFYSTHREAIATEDYTGLSSYSPFVSAADFSTSLKQGHDSSVEIPKLRGLDLFCGGGNFGRGLEDGGAIEMRWANDYDTKAIHTYMANNSEVVHPFLGSIDDLQRRAIQGDFAKNVPRVGDVDFISGGSPCPGFSRLTNDKTTVAQRKNQSLVAAFASFIDLYRPKYGLLENVPGIVQKQASRHQDVFSQLICAIVGLGYQPQFFFFDASSCGSPQRRSRVFLAFAAPGYKFPERPQPTHSHPPGTKYLSLGSLPTGESMAERLMPTSTPFKFVSFEEATGDLPPVYDAKPDICVSFPDHRVSLGITKDLRFRIACIPTRPHGMNFAQAWYGPTKQIPGSGILTPAERALFPLGGSSTSTSINSSSDNGKEKTPSPSKISLNRVGPNSNAYGRQFPTRLIETIVTSQSPSDAKNGRHLHWRENRVLTIQEARRAQGFRDDEVLLGLPSDQYRIVGNSVAREVSVALGLAFRDAWVESLRCRRDGDDYRLDCAMSGNVEGDDSGDNDDSNDGQEDSMSWEDVTEELESRKRRQISFTVEIPSSKMAKFEKGDTPGSQRRNTPSPSLQLAEEAYSNQ